MSRFIAIIDYDEATGSYGAHFPDAPGATAMGATADEVVDNAIEALAEWVADEIADGREVPKPRSYIQLLKAREFDLGKGGMIATVPLLRESGKPVRANVSIDAGLLETIDAEADRLGLTRSAFLASAARDKIKASA